MCARACTCASVHVVTWRGEGWAGWGRRGRGGLWGQGQHSLTFKEEGLVPVGVQVLPLHLGLQLVLFVWQQVDLDEGVAGAAEVLGWQLLGLHDLHGERGLLEVVADTELDPAQVLSAAALVDLVLLRAWGELGTGGRGRQRWGGFCFPEAPSAAQQGWEASLCPRPAQPPPPPGHHAGLVVAHPTFRSGRGC